MRRMISDTLQKYLKQVKETYPDPTNIGGPNYTNGLGIDITYDVISVDDTVAFKREIPTVVDTVANGNMNPVTSNAVYDIVGDIETLLQAI